MIDFALAHTVCSPLTNLTTTMEKEETCLDKMRENKSSLLEFGYFHILGLCQIYSTTHEC